MDAQQFLAEFGHIANAPGGVARLRELVLQLAISGRLVSREENETPLAESMAQAFEQRNHYGREHGLRVAQVHEPVRTKPYAIPDHWRWERLERLTLYIQRGKSPSYADHGKVRVISQKCVQWNGFDFTLARYVADQSLAAYGNERFLRGGDLLWNSTGTGTVGRVAICQTVEETYCVADSHVTVIRLSEAVLPRYLWCVIASPWVQTRFQPTHPDSLVSGTTQQVELATSSARALPIPVPPLEEQARIVAKVDELMVLCDKLEDEQQKRRKLQNTLRQATLQAVAKAQSPHELQASWARLEANFGHLFSVPEDVAEFRNLILDLAATGFLSEPWTDDSDPVAIVTQANLQQEAEFNVRERREINTLPEPTYDRGRILIALGRIVKLVSGQHLSPEEYNSRQDGIPYITGPAEFKDRKPFPSKWTTERRAVARDGDILITVKGSGVGKTAQCNLKELAISRQLMAIRSVGNLDRSYLAICIDSAERGFQEQKFGIAIPGIGRDEVLGLQILLPGIEEQGRIVKEMLNK